MHEHPYVVLLVRYLGEVCPRSVAIEIALYYMLYCSALTLTVWTIRPTTSRIIVRVSLFCSSVGGLMPIRS